MCKAADVAIEFIDRSIDLWERNDDSNYLLDYVKLHKLMYLGQCYIMSLYKLKLFEDKISAHRCGPYVDGIDFVPAYCGFGKIKKKIDKSIVKLAFLPISYTRKETVEYILNCYGKYSTDEIVKISKDTYAYKKVFEQESNDKPLIPDDDIIRTGNELLEQLK